MRLTELTEDQADYIDVNVDGPFKPALPVLDFPDSLILVNMHMNMELEVFDETN